MTYSLFDNDDRSPVYQPPAQQRSPTSVEAAQRIAHVAGRDRLKVFHWLRDRGAEGGTDEEIQTALAMNPSTERPRRGELVDRGFVRDSGRKRKTRSGREAVVWVAVTRE